MKKFTSKSQKIGEIGENVACKYFTNKGFQVIERNYTQKWGEIDIILRNKDKIHFIEVKSVSCESFKEISHETAAIDSYRPEDQMHYPKRKRLLKTIQTYMQEHPVGDWQFDVVCVFLNRRVRIARIKIIPDVILS